MFPADVDNGRLVPHPRAASAVAALYVDERDRDVAGVAIPRAEVQMIVRYDGPARGGLDVHVFGARETVRRKILRRGQRAVTARLRLSATAPVLGVPASALAGRIVGLADLWGDAAARRLLDWLASARDTRQAAAMLDHALFERLETAKGARRAALTQGVREPAGLALTAAGKLEDGTGEAIAAVAAELGVTDRHLRRVFRETVGMSPKAFAKLARFHRALHAARATVAPHWARIAAEAGYYDQAHLIADFRAIAGVTPPALLGELRAGPPVG